MHGKVEIIGVDPMMDSPDKMLDIARDIVGYCLLIDCPV